MSSYFIYMYISVPDLSTTDSSQEVGGGRQQRAPESPERMAVTGALFIQVAKREVIKQ